MAFLNCRGPCKKKRLETYFDISNRETGARQPFCRMCRREYQNKYYRRTSALKKVKSKQRAARRVAEARELVCGLKSEPCKDCNKSFHWFAMEFDHNDSNRKVANISYMVLRGYAKSVILEEIEKCDLLCAICHRMRTGRRLGLIEELAPIA